MKQSEEHLKNLRQLLALEYEADVRQWEEKVKPLTINDRVRQGYTWYPVTLQKQGFAIGNRAFVILEKAAVTTTFNQFKSGIPVKLFTTATGVSGPPLSGVIQYVTDTRMKVILRAEDVPDWVLVGPIGVDLEFDRRTYQDMDKALEKALTSDREEIRVFRDILSGHKLPETIIHPEVLQVDTLNPSQSQAVQGMMASSALSLIHGPPGTGKTTTVVAGIGVLVGEERTVLVCAPSNTATDLLAERLALSGLNVVRIGHISRIDEGIHALTLDARIAAHPDSREIKKVKIQAAEARKKAGRYKRQFDAEARFDRQSNYKEAKELEAWAKQLEDRLLKDILDQAQVIACTLSGAGHSLLGQRRFRTLIVDEAAQALEPAVWIALHRVDRVILAGDPFQLPPTVKSAEAARKGLGVTIMERLLPSIAQSYLLTTQYRMHPRIMDFSNQWFYAGKLNAAEGLEAHSLPGAVANNLLFIDTSGCGFEEKINPKTLSRYNPDEWILMTCHLEMLRESLLEKTWPEITILSPYREQVSYIKKAIQADPIYAELAIDVRTIDGFQGQETDVIMVSLVRSNAQNELGFLKDYRRMNVAMTRAKMQLVVVGDGATIGMDPFYDAFIRHCEATDAWRSAWEYIHP